MPGDRYHRPTGLLGAGTILGTTTIPDAPEIEMALMASNRCDRCRSETTSVIVDAGAGTDLPLFIVGERPTGSAGEAVQVLPHRLKGRLCLNCGLLSAQVRLSREEVETYRAKLQQTSSVTLIDRRPIPPEATTWIKRPKKRG